MNGSAATLRPTCFIVHDRPHAGERGADGRLQRHLLVDAPLRMVARDGGCSLEDLGGRRAGIPAGEARAGAHGAVGHRFVTGIEEGAFHGVPIIADPRVAAQEVASVPANPNPQPDLEGNVFMSQNRRACSAYSIRSAWPGRPAREPSAPQTQKPDSAAGPLPHRVLPGPRRRRTRARSSRRGGRLRPGNARRTRLRPRGARQGRRTGAHLRRRRLAAARLRPGVIGRHDELAPAGACRCSPWVSSPQRRVATGRT